MNHSLMRRRFLIVWPWASDISKGLGLIALIVLSMWLLDHLAQTCTTIGWCA